MPFRTRTRATTCPAQAMVLWTCLISTAPSSSACVERKSELALGIALAPDQFGDFSRALLVG